MVYVYTHTPYYRIFCIIIRYKYVEVLKLVVWYKINRAINPKSKTIMFEFFHLSLAEITSCVLGKVNKMTTCTYRENSTSSMWKLKLKYICEHGQTR